MDFRSIIAALVLSTASYVASAANNNYKHLGERPASGVVKTAFYAFNYEVPNTGYTSMGWKAYSDLREPRNAVMVTGMTGYDTYALSVLYQGTAKAGQGALQLAGAMHPNMTFLAGPNPACVNTSLDQPFELSERMVNFMAVCVDKDSLAIYELGISWKSLILAVRSIDEIVRESGECVAAKAANPEVRCPDRLDSYIRSFRTLLASFALSSG
ncbi:MAG: hypothetical protein JNM76_09615 [Betaproteobacteria bacterium]|nr:hypothetical protein [Betaproteobacteria bacterium]